MHSDLRLAGLLPPLDAPHHMRASEWSQYREGLVLKVQPGVGSYVDIGLDRMAFVPQAVAANTRVTLAVGESQQVQFMPDFGENMILGQVSWQANAAEQEGGGHCTGNVLIILICTPGSKEHPLKLLCCLRLPAKRRWECKVAGDRAY
eukprot:GHRQ01011940.1.p2 GENE.GHRQ01011940.1~~GHRQ01011940.1.p2  ORF type:complete len:148 (+),score=40.20 GHRQ01011940.1:444-887(+)